MEIWKTIEGFSGKYEVSSLGNVRSKKTLRLLKKFNNYLGYVIVGLRDYENRKTMSVSRLVASAFLSKTEIRKEVNHKDGDKNNNKLSNLEYVTRSENVRHAIKNGLLKHGKGSENRNSKLTESEVQCIRDKYTKGVNQFNTGYGLDRLAKEYNVGQTTISHIIKKRHLEARLNTGVKMKITTAKNYLKSENVKQGDVVTILSEGEMVASSRYTYQNGEPRKDFLLKVKHNDSECDLRVNATNKKILVAAFGDETKDWIGKQVKIDTSSIMVSGKMMKTIIMLPVGGKSSSDYEA